MNGQTCLVTGATHGVGLATARALAAAGASVVLHGRDPQRTRTIADDLARETDVPVRAVHADFARLADVRALAAELDASLARLDVLVNNAGMLSARRALSADGYELTFAVNHLAPFLLTNLLLPALRRAAAARIVIVSSAAHARARLDFADLMNEHVAPGLGGAYARSKLANLLFMRELAARLRGSAVTTNALHPGVVASHLFQNLPAPLRLLVGTAGRLAMLSPEEGARTSVYLASSPEVAGTSGGYYVRCRPATPSRAAQSDADAARLWQESARLTALRAA
jgi:NAD(P)-dependent dehydrogenase (short-subunit alcohol dehydrogenase family)